MTERVLQPLLTCHGSQSVPSGEFNICLSFSNGILRGKDLHTCLGDRKPPGKKCMQVYTEQLVPPKLDYFFDRITKLMDDGNEID